LEKNERQIALLEKEKKISELLLLGTAAIAVLVLTLALVLYNRFQIKHKANKNLEEAYRKLTETQEQLIHHKKMSSLGRLTTGLSHELQNPLNFVNNFSEVVDDLLQELDTASMNPDQQAIVDELKSSSAKIGLHGKRAQRIVHQMQEHSDMVPGEAESVDMNAIVLQCLDRAYQEQKAENDSFDCKVVRELDLSMPQARVQVSQFIRVWHNIFRNAFQSVKQKAQETPRYVPEVRVVSSHRGNHIRIACRDNGVGMDPKTLERAYEPFFTTKPTGTATGLGLSLSYDIVTAHHGEITAMSEKGVFAEFVVNLPVEADGL